MFDVDEFLLTIDLDEIASIRNFCGLSLKLKQALLEILRPALRGIVFLPSLKAKLAAFEKEGNLPVEVRSFQ